MSSTVSNAVAGVPVGDANNPINVVFPSSQTIDISGPGDTITPVDNTGAYVALATASAQSTTNTKLDSLITELGQKTEPGDTQLVKQTGAATATLANVSSSATNVTLQASNSSRRGLSIFNDSSDILYVKFGATASSTSFTVKMLPGSYYEMPTPVYTGIVDGIWSVATGSARMTEIT